MKFLTATMTIEMTLMLPLTDEQATAAQTELSNAPEETEAMLSEMIRAEQEPMFKSGPGFGQLTNLTVAGIKIVDTD